jgi:hypothetical protein
MLHKLLGWWYKRRNVLFIDKQRRVIVVRRLDGNAMTLKEQGWTVIEAGELRLMTLDTTPARIGTLSHCSPPFGLRGRYVTAAHCVQFLTPVYAECAGALRMTRANVVEIEELRPVSWRCIFGGCVNERDYAVIDRGNDGFWPDLVLSFGSVRGDLAGFTSTPQYSGNPVGRCAQYLVYDYEEGTVVTKTARIIAHGVASVVGPDGREYRIRAYLAVPLREGDIIAKPGYSGSCARVVDCLS